MDVRVCSNPRAESSTSVSASRFCLEGCGNVAKIVGLREAGELRRAKLERQRDPRQSGLRPNPCTKCSSGISSAMSGPVLGA